MQMSKNIPKIAYNEREAGAYLNLSLPMLRKWRREGGGPAFIKVGRRVLYDISDLEIFWKKLKRHETLA